MVVRKFVCKKLRQLLTYIERNKPEETIDFTKCLSYYETTSFLNRGLISIRIDNGYYDKNGKRLGWVYIKPHVPAIYHEYDKLKSGEKIIELQVEDYCQRCKDFKPEVVRTYGGAYETFCCSQVVYCKNKERCAAIYKSFVKEYKRKEENDVN